MMVDVKLLPCPFCGSPGEIEQTAGGQAVGFGEVYRGNCKYAGHASLVWMPDRQDAITAWNTRLQPSGDGEIVNAFLRAIMNAGPNGEAVSISYHPNGDWDVYGRSSPPPAKAAEIGVVERLEAALGEIYNLPGELNMGNYSDDDVRELNNNFIEAIMIAEKALEAVQHTTTPKEDI